MGQLPISIKESAGRALWKDSRERCMRWVLLCVDRQPDQLNSGWRAASTEQHLRRDLRARSNSRFNQQWRHNNKRWEEENGRTTEFYHYAHRTRVSGYRIKWTLIFIPYTHVKSHAVTRYRHAGEWKSRLHSFNNKISGCVAYLLLLLLLALLLPLWDVE